MALLFTLLCGLSLSILGYFGYFFERGHFIHGAEEVIDTEIRHLTPSSALNKLPLVDTIAQHQVMGRLFVPFGPNGEIPALLSGKVERLKEGVILFEHPISRRTYAAKIHTFEDQHKLLVGIDITETRREFRWMQWLTIISITLIIIVVLVSYMIRVFVASGTNKIATTAQKIMDTGDLSKRLAISSHWDDFGKMTNTLNLMLDRIEVLMGGLHQMADNIAHDLRTPLTRLRNHIEAANKGADTVEGQALLDEADRLLNTFNALLRISRIETEKKREHFQALDFRTLIEDVIALYEPLAEIKHISIQQRLLNLTCFGDKDLLFQAYANIIDNAIKYTPEHGRVSIRMHSEDEWSVVVIDDTGGGVPTPDLDKIFQRFYRADISRSTSGTGLGLSLVKVVFDLHNASLVLERSSKGLRFITRIITKI